MKRISLIANSHIQYYKYEIEIDLSFGKVNKLYYHQPFDNNALSFILDPLYKVVESGDERFYRTEELLDKDFLVNNRLKDDVDLDSCAVINDVYEETNLKRALRNFSNKWIPLPYFKDNSINKDLMYPTDWVRVFITCDDSYTVSKIALAIDTTLARNESDKTSPMLSLNPDENIFKLHSKEVNIARSFYAGSSNDSWVDKYLADSYYGEQDERRYEQPVKEYLASYILLVKWLASHPNFPELQLFTDDFRKKTVDLVIDIGNSATCALLFETKDDDNFEFDSVKKLIIQDYSTPHVSYDQSFPMHVVFSESKFGNINKDSYHNNKFIIPSLVRIGYEAEQLINQSIVNLDLGYELKTFNSSPKRYLWDDRIAEREWEFHPTIYDKQVKKVYLNGISEQLNSDGTLLKNDGFFGSKSLFSKSSLMKFVFLELLIHAHVQINSYGFREEHGEMTVPRSIRRITISCPTAMIQHEQIALRQAAEEACQLLVNYQKYYFDIDNFQNWFDTPEIIPATKDISKKISQLEDRKDWIYDEATCSQLVFIYSLLAKKLRGNSYVIEHFLFKNKDKIRIGSIDIGAGTTDLMINEYELNEEYTIQNFKPQPLFWDSFKMAGDDLVKELIQKIIIKGTADGNLKSQFMGLLENHGLTMGIANIRDRLNGFFGENTNNTGYLAKMMRKAFIHQVALPIIYRCLALANTEEDVSFSTQDLLGENFKNVELQQYFENYFGFSFLDVQWCFSPSVINAIVTDVFDSLIRQISVVLNQYDCDYVVLSGKPASLKSFEDLFRKYLSCSQSNVVNLNNYWFGKWYPFADNSGVINDPKTIVSVGAIIALMAGKLKKIQDFKLDTEQLKQSLISTADYIVKKNFNTKEAILSPLLNEHEFLVKQWPYHLGYTQYLAQNYPYSSLYKLEINLLEIERSVRQKHAGRDEGWIQQQTNLERNAILQQMPIRVRIGREIEDSKEEIKILQVEDVEGNNKPNKYFLLSYQTLEQELGYWLDTCEFVL